MSPLSSRASLLQVLDAVAECNYPVHVSVNEPWHPDAYATVLLWAGAHNIEPSISTVLDIRAAQIDLPNGVRISATQRVEV